MPVGTRTLDIVDAVQGAVIPTRLLYPTVAASGVEAFGPYALDVAVGAPLEGADHPVVVISHGTGGSPWLYRDLAHHLALSGFVVAMPEHPGNNRNDNHLAGTPALLAHRPRHLRLVLDALDADNAASAPPRAAVIGHSLGGYTALAVAGGQPSALPNETPDGRAHPVAVIKDPRVRALVLLAPATPWYMATGALAGVDVPVLMYSGERDALAPPMFTDIVRRDVRELDHRVVPNAGHFSFASPFPPAMTSPSFPPSQDPPGFDRAAYQPLLHAEITAFLRRVLAA